VKHLVAKSWTIVAAGLLVLAVLAAWFTDDQIRQSEASFRATTANELATIAAIIAEDLQHGEYVAAADAVEQWARPKPEILSVHVTGADGYPIAAFDRGGNRERSLTVAVTLPYSYRGEAHVTLVKDFLPLKAARRRLIADIAALYLLVAVFVVLLMRALLLYRAEAHRLRQQINVNRNLEQQHDDVDSRNAQLAALVRHSQEFVGIATLDGRADFVNAVGRKLVDMGPEGSLSGLSITDFVHPEDQERLALEVLPTVLTCGRWSGELNFRRQSDGAAIPMLVETFLINDINGRPRWIATMSLDITERKRLETSLAAEARRNRLFLLTASDGVHIQNAAGKLVEVSASFCKMLGYERDEMLGMHPAQWDARPKGEELRSAFAALKNGGPKRFNTLHRRKDGSVFPVEVHSVPFDVDGEHYVYCSSRDMTEQRRLEDALLHAVSAEQQKLGRDVHDGLGQELSGISMLAAGIAFSLKKAGRPEADELEGVANLARQAMANCRAIAHGLSPVAFADGGLISILQEMVTLQRNSFGIDARCAVIQGAPLRLETDTVESLYRIAQEAVANARLHGHAKSIQITLNVQPATVRLDVLDDGVGLNSPLAMSTGMGLKIMQVRASIAGARLSIGPGDQGGTRVTCECPQSTGDVAATA
jgi:PAS domain S-box-containing protein